MKPTRHNARRLRIAHADSGESAIEILRQLKLGGEVVAMFLDVWPRNGPGDLRSGSGA